MKQQPVEGFKNKPVSCSTLTKVENLQKGVEYWMYDDGQDMWVPGYKYCGLCFAGHVFDDTTEHVMGGEMLMVISCDDVMGMKQLVDRGWVAYRWI